MGQTVTSERGLPHHAFVDLKGRVRNVGRRGLESWIHDLGKSLLRNWMVLVQKLSEGELMNSSAFRVGRDG